MANVKISGLPAATSVTAGTDVAPLVSGGITTKATPQQIVNAGLAAPGAIGGTTRGTAAFTTELVGPSASANFTRFPNALTVISNTSAGIQQNETHNMGIMAEGTANAADTSIYGVGVYGVGYTASGTRCGGVIGEGHVSASADTGSAIGVRGYANDTHAGGLNIGIYGDCANGSSNYALYLNNGDIYTAGAKTWTLNGNLTFSGAYTVTVPTLSVSTTVSGTGFTTYLASPPAIGTTAPAAGKFTDLTSTGNTTIGDASTDTFTVYPQTISLINSTAITAASTKSLTLNGGAGSNGLVLDSNNSLGYAAAPSAWFTTNGNRAIDVGTYASFAQIGSTGGAAVVSNAYLTSASQWTAKNTNGATLYQTYPTAHDWSYAPSVTGGTALTFVKAMTLDSTGSLLIVGPGGLGYGTGSGGAVTQATSRTTGVTLNKTNGAITLFSVLAVTTYQTFTVTNSTVAAADVIHVCQRSGADKYIILVTAVAAGSFAITFAATAATATEQPVFNFAVIKAVTA